MASALARVLQSLGGKTSLYGFGANLFNQGVTVAVQLIGVPIFLHHWGIEAYGDWLILYSTAFLVSLFIDLGLSHAVGNEMSSLVARNLFHHAQQLFCAMLLAGCGMFLFSSLTLIPLILFAPIEEVFRFSGKIPLDQLRYAFSLLVISFSIHIFEAVNHTVFRADGDYGFHVFIYNLTRLVQFIVVWVLVVMGFSVVAVCGMFLAVRVVGTATSTFSLLNRHRWVGYTLRGASLKELRCLALPSLANVLMMLSQGITVQGVIVVIGAVLGAKEAVVFSVLRTASRFITQVVQALGQSIEPEAAVAYALGDTGRMRKLFRSSVILSAVFGVAAAIFLGGPGRFLIEMWTGGKVVVEGRNAFLFWLLLFEACIGSIWFMAYSLKKAVNEHVDVSIVTSVVSCVSIAVSWCVMKFGFSSALVMGIALMVASVLCGIYVFTNGVKEDWAA